MDDAERSDVTRLLRDGRAGEAELVPLVYDELRAIARARMESERSGHTLQATALVNEAWMRLAGDASVPFENRRHFYAAAAEAMRRVLIDHARRVASEKRGGNRERVTLGDVDEPFELPADDVLALGEALERLAREDPQAAEVARMRYLSGLSVEETAKALSLSERTVHREWTYARACLVAWMGGER